MELRTIEIGGKVISNKELVVWEILNVPSSPIGFAIMIEAFDCSLVFLVYAAHQTSALEYSRTRTLSQVGDCTKYFVLSHCDVVLCANIKAQVQPQFSRIHF